MRAATMSGESTHMAVPRSETSSSMPSTVFSRWKSAAATPPAGVGQEVGEEHVGALDQADEERAALVGPEVDADAALVPPELLDDEVASRRPRDHAARDQAADRIAMAGVLDLDHLRAPVAERGAGRGDEAPVRDLRSEERRVGKECRYRRSPDRSKQNMRS